MRKRRCIVCGKEFITTSAAQKICSKPCRNVRRGIKEKELEEKELARERMRGKRSSGLADTNEQARAAGLTYGQYVAQRYLRQQGGVQHG